MRNELCMRGRRRKVMAAASQPSPAMGSAQESAGPCGSILGLQEKDRLLIKRTLLKISLCPRVNFPSAARSS